ncbi:MAG TPA: TetR/AcrR family transcriptional regulator [Actinomycetales bacterium]|nr:TetR/AcrR family transcriptional regulator [Actinomycetales bacterium]
MRVVSEGGGLRSAKMSVDEAILHAARESMMEMGLRRTSIAEIARRAGVSRPTVYRRYADINAIATEVATREFIRVLEGLRVMPGDARARIVARFRIIVETLASGGFFLNLAETDPELIIRSIMSPRGASQQAIIDQFILPGIVHGQEDGSVRDSDPTVLADNVYMVMLSAILTCSAMLRDGRSATHAVGEVAEMVDRYLLPM